MRCSAAPTADSLDADLPTREAFREDLIKAYSDFIHALYEAGCRSLQLDDCTWGMLCDTERRKALYGGQTDADAVAQLYVDLNNAVIDCVPRGMVVNTHICRGNYHSTWASSGGYALVSKILFGQERVDGYYLEFDDERSGGFEPLADAHRRQDRGTGSHHLQAPPAGGQGAHQGAHSGSLQVCAAGPALPVAPVRFCLH